MKQIKYNPAFLTPEERAQRFGGRQHDLDELLRIVRENSQRRQNQHVLVVGPRGMGKTTLLLRTVDEILADPELSSHWLPVVAPEEAYRVATIGELWLETVFNLERATGDPAHLQVYENLRAAHEDAGSEEVDRRLASAALGYLRDVADRQGRKILLVVENLQMLLGEQLSDRDAWALRETLIGESRLMLLASAVASFEGIEDPGKPLYEQLLVHRLEPLDTDQCVELWRHLTGEKVPKRRMRALEILTGGNPRLLVILAEFAAKLSLRELTADLANLIDDHTDYLKMTTEALPAQERKIFVSLAEIWDYASTADIARQARLDPSVVSAQLNRLVRKGAVSFRRKGRGKQYQVAERLYSIYHLMRRRGGVAARARAATEFMVAYYDKDTLARQVQVIAGEALKLPEEERLEHILVASSLLKSPSLSDRRERILAAVPSEISRVLVPAVFESCTEGAMNSPLSDSRLQEREMLFLSSEQFHAAAAKVAGLTADSEDLGIAQVVRELLASQRSSTEGSLVVLTRAAAASVLYQLEHQQEHLEMSLEFSAAALERIRGIATELSKYEVSVAVTLCLTVGLNLGWTDTVEESHPLWKEWISVLARNKYFFYSLGRAGAVRDDGSLLGLVGRLAADAGANENSIARLIDLSIGFASVSGAAKLLEILEKANLAPRIEPLILALRISEGHETTAPQEIEEVAKDIVRQIRGEDTLDSIAR